MTRIARIARRSATVAVIAAAATYAAVHWAPLPAAPAPPPQPESMKIVDARGRLLYDAAGPDDAHFTALPLDAIPVRLRQAVVATEDASFYDNPGISLRGIVRAGLSNLRSGSARSGGSTITQQLARNLYVPPHERSAPDAARKLRETVLALRLERTYTKDEILELYLNRVFFGNLAYGAEAAARTHFGRSARDLDLAESALLAGLLQSPAAYDPFTHPDAARARQSIVLDRMTAEGYISQREADAARREPLAFNRTPFPIEAPHFVAWIQEQLPALAGEDAMARGGLLVTTSLDLDLQHAAEHALARHVERLKDHDVTNGAVVAIDPATGHVLAMAGSADYFDASIDGAYNGALANRQPGSSIKPIVYAAALEAGYTPATPLLDIPTALTTAQGDPYSPNNYDYTFHGVVPLREALASSYNVPAARTLAAIGVEPAVALGRRLGLSTLGDPARYGLSFALGGAEVRLLDLTAAYASLAAGGVRVAPVAILRIEDGSGRVLYEAPPPERDRVISEQTAFLLSDILSDNDARTPGFGADSVLRLSRPAAVKTGTTTDFRDNWTIGYAPNIAAGVWVGNADNSAMRDVSGVDGAAPVWHEVMEAAFASRPAQPFDMPDGNERVTVCVPSGLLPTPSCLRRREEVFAEGTVPTRTDDYYGPVLICDATGAAVTRSEECRGAARERVFAFVPPEAIPWARAAGIALPPLPPYAAAPWGRGTSAMAVRIVSPAEGTVLHISRELRMNDQLLRLEVQPDGAIQSVVLYIDGAPIAHLYDPPYRTAWQLVAGPHDVRARAVTASGEELWSDTVTFDVWPP